MNTAKQLPRVIFSTLTNMYLGPLGWTPDKTKAERFETERKANSKVMALCHSKWHYRVLPIAE